MNPISRRELIKRLRKSFGFEGPFSGKKHPFMRKGSLTLVIPNPHGEDIREDLLSKILEEARISKKEWDKSK